MTINKQSFTIYGNNVGDHRNYDGGPSMLSILDLCTKDQRSLQKFQSNVDWLVTENKVTSFYDLHDDEKETLVGHLISALDNPQEWVAECKDADMITRSLAKYMQTQKEVDRDYFLTLFKANAVKYWADRLDSFIKSSSRAYERSKRDNHIDSQIQHKLAIGF